MFSNRSIITGMAICLVSLTGCAGVRETWQSWWNPREPYEVLLKAEQGDERAWALGRLKEPIKNGGSQQDQERVVLRLNTAARTEKTIPARLNAIQSMAKFSDPRIVRGLEDAYYNADDFGPEGATVIRAQVLTALGEVGHPDGLRLLTTVLNAPEVADTVSAQERQNQMDERLAATRALSKFQDPKAVAALESVLKREKNVALRNRARESLELASGRELPPDVLPAPGSQPGLPKRKTIAAEIDGAPRRLPPPPSGISERSEP